MNIKILKGFTTDEAYDARYSLISLSSLSFLGLCELFEDELVNIYSLLW